MSGKQYTQYPSAAAGGAENGIFQAWKIAVLLPTYNNALTLSRVLDGVRLYTKQVIVVNDGSTDATAEILSGYTDITLVAHSVNRGKGLALRTGFKEALRQGYDYVITIDSDGQHFPDDLPVFLNELSGHGPALMIGARNMQQEGVPAKSSFGNRFSNFWFFVETGIRLSDTQSGFRLYPVREMAGMRFYTRKFEFEVEVIVRAAWEGIPVKNVPVRVKYDPAERVSHFRPFRDFTRISILNTVLVPAAILWYRPRMLLRKIVRKGWKRFFSEDLLKSNDSPAKKSWSVALGIFIGLSPFWGFQTALAFLLAWIFRLNKLIAFTCSNVSIPPLIPFIIYAGFRTGCMVLGKDFHTVFRPGEFDSHKTFIKQHLQVYVTGSLLLGACIGAAAGAATFLFLLRKRRK